MDLISMTTEETVKTFGVGGGTILAAFILLRKYVSSDKVDRKTDESAIQIIESLQELVKNEREARTRAEQRADQFAKERNELVKIVGQLEGKLEVLVARLENFERMTKTSPFWQAVTGNCDAS